MAVDVGLSVAPSPERIQNLFSKCFFSVRDAIETLLAIAYDFVVVGTLSKAHLRVRSQYFAFPYGPESVGHGRMRLRTDLPRVTAAAGLRSYKSFTRYFLSWKKIGKKNSLLSLRLCDGKGRNEKETETKSVPKDDQEWNNTT